MHELIAITTPHVATGIIFLRSALSSISDKLLMNGSDSDGFSWRRTVCIFSSQHVDSRREIAGKLLSFVNLALVTIDQLCSFAHVHCTAI